MREYATFVEEGIRAAISDEEERARRPVRLQVFDSGGRPEEAQDLLAELEQSGAVAIVGPLQDATLGRVAGSRRRPLPIVTPTARTLPEGEEAVYSLAGPDPGAARALARYARQSGIDRVVVLSASSQQSMFDAEVFASTFRSVGGDVLREMSYPSGQTDFREEMREIARLQPDGLVLPVPAADVRLVAPQVTFFGPGFARNPSSGHCRLGHSGCAPGGRSPTYRRRLHRYAAPSRRAGRGVQAIRSDIRGALPQVSAQRHPGARMGRGGGCLLRPSRAARADRATFGRPSSASRRSKGRPVLFPSNPAASYGPTTSFGS